MDSWIGSDGLPTHPCANPHCITCEGYGVVVIGVDFNWCPDCILVGPSGVVELGVVD